MTRALHSTAAVRLLKDAFLAKDVRITHTEALDLFAQLQGFNAWSHMSAADAVPGPVPVAGSKPEGPQPNTLEHMLLAAAEGAPGCARFPRSDWMYQVENGDTSLGYQDWVRSEFAVHFELGSTDVVFDNTPQVEVYDHFGVLRSWKLQYDLTNRDGDINAAFLHKKPALVTLALADPARLDELRELMVYEDSFIAYKDGQYGILLEIEYETQESVGSPDYAPEATVLARLVKSLALLAPCYPKLSLGIKPEATGGRLAVWCFLPEMAAKAMTAEQRSSLRDLLDYMAVPETSDEYFQTLVDANCIKPYRVQILLADGAIAVHDTMAADPADAVRLTEQVQIGGQLLGVLPLDASTTTQET